MTPTKKLAHHNATEMPLGTRTVFFLHGYYKPARLSGHPDNWAPAEGEMPEVVRVMDTTEDGEDVEIPLNTIPQKELRGLEEACWEYQQAMDADQAESRGAWGADD